MRIEKELDKLLGKVISFKIGDYYVLHDEPQMCLSCHDEFNGVYVLVLESHDEKIELSLCAECVRRLYVT